MAASVRGKGRQSALSHSAAGVWKGRHGRVFVLIDLSSASGVTSAVHRFWMTSSVWQLSKP